VLQVELDQMFPLESWWRFNHQKHGHPAALGIDELACMKSRIFYSGFRLINGQTALQPL
jgi:hypothetical protein